MKEISIPSGPHITDLSRAEARSACVDGMMASAIAAKTETKGRTVKIKNGVDLICVAML